MREDEVGELAGDADIRSSSVSELSIVSRYACSGFVGDIDAEGWVGDKAEDIVLTVLVVPVVYVRLDGENRGCGFMAYDPGV